MKSIAVHLIPSSLLAILSSCSGDYRIEWNANNRTDVPVEICFDSEKMKGRNWGVFADGNEIPAATLDNGREGEVTLRFSVPEGTQGLSMKRSFSGKQALASDGVDNLFRDASWTADEHSEVVIEDGKTVLASRDFEVGFVRASIDLADKGLTLAQDEFRGVPVQAELDVRGLSKVTFPVKIYFRQYFPDGKEIPDDVCDARWTSGFMPWDNGSGFIKFRTSGYIHPLASRIEAVVEFHPCRNDYGRDGLKVMDQNDNLPSLEIGRLAMRPANRLPFPHFDDAFFAEGISGNESDKSLVFDGSLGFWFCTRTSGCWAKGAQFRDPASFNFPDREGTVEAWFCPEWNGNEDLFIPLFEASHYNSLGSEYGRFALGKCLALSYNPAKKILHLLVRDPLRKRFDGKSAVSIAIDEWCHLAVTFVADKKAYVYKDGEIVLEMGLEGWHFVDNGKENIVNDRYPSEFHIGCSYVNSCNGVRTNRISSRRPGALQPELRVYTVSDTTDTYYKGKVDLLRISRVPRYDGGFTPERSFKLDDGTCALFDFNHSFDGRSSGTSLGYVSATVFAHRPLVVHRLGDVQYFPDAIAAENNPVESVNKRNFINIPGDGDFLRSEKTERRTFDVQTGDSFSISAQEGAQTDCIEIENTGNTTLDYPIVLGEGDIDYRSYEDMRRTMGLEGLSKKEVADKLLAFLNDRTDYYMNYPAYFAPDSDEAVCLSGNTPGTWGAHFSGSQALIHLNGYVGMECGPLNRIASAVYANVGGLPAEECCGYGHEFQQVYYNGNWHLYDQSAKTYFTSMDNETAASLEEADREPEVFARQGKTPGPYIRQGHRTVDANVVFYHEKTAATLRPQERVRLWTGNNGLGVDIHTQRKLVENDMIPRWDIGNYPFYDYADSCHAYGNDPIYRIDRLFPQYANGVLEWKGKPSAENPAFDMVKHGSFCFRMRSPLPVVAAEYGAVDVDGQSVPLDISTDGGKTFRPFKSPATYAVRCRMAYYIRVNADIDKIREFDAKTTFVINPRVLTGNLHKGRNNLKLVAENKGKARVTVQYRTPGKEIVFDGELNHGTIPGFGYSTFFMDPLKGKTEIPVSGLSEEAFVQKVADGIDAGLEFRGGKAFLLLESHLKDAGFAWVTLRDGDVQKTLTLVSVPGCRVIYPNAVFSKKGDVAHLEFEPLPEGNYTLLHLDRFPSVSPTDRCNAVSVTCCGNRYPALCESNSACDLLKQRYGLIEDGARGRWKWEYLIDYRYEFPFFGFKSIRVDEGCHGLDYEYVTNEKEGPVELKAVIIIPYPSLEFKRRVFEYLISLNNRQWAM